MTAKEKLLERVPRLSEAQAVAVLHVVESQEELEVWFEAERPEELEAWSDTATRGAFDELDRRENEEGFSWERRRPA